MKKLEVKVKQFCALSRSKPWQIWLGQNAPDLLEELQEVLKKYSCNKNKQKMVEIYNKIYELGLGARFESFIKNKYPVLISKSTKQVEKKNFKKKIITDDINKHGVFKSYRPELLSFPQKTILVGNNLEDRVRFFIRDKTSVDYVIIEDRAYIEYFNLKYSDVARKVPLESRDIYCYRMRQKQDEN